jgi:leader peptidase (prepilin peptidase)/N-methyltransferase
MLQRGRCRHCSGPISVRYPLIELLCAALSGFTAWHFGFGMAGAAALLFLWALIALCFIDLDTQLLPDSITLPLLWAGLLLNLSGTFTDISSAVVGAAAGYLTLWSVFWLFKLTTGKEGMGYGDFKLLAALGAWLGATAILPIVLMASVLGAVIGLMMKASGSLRQGRFVPFGPFLAGGGVVVILAGLSTVLGWIGW